MPTALDNIINVFIAIWPYLLVFLAVCIALIAAEAVLAWWSFRRYQRLKSSLEEENDRNYEKMLQKVAADPEPEPLVDFAK